MKKLMIAVLAGALLATSQVRAETATNAPSDWSYNAGLNLMSKYYGTIFGGIFYDGPMSWVDVNASTKNALGAFTASVVLGQKLDRLNTFNADGGNEYDIGVNQTIALGSKSYPILVSVGAMYLFVTDLRTSGDDAFDETIRLDFPIQADRVEGPIVQPYIQAFHYHMVGNGLQDEGYISYAGLIRNQDIGGFMFNLDYRAGINSGVYDSQAGLEYQRLTVSLPIQNGAWTFTPAIIGQIKGDQDRTYVKEDEIYYTLDIRYTF